VISPTLHDFTDSPQDMLPVLQLMPGAHRRIRRGHLWVYRDELQPPLPTLEPGAIVRVETSYGYDLGVGFYHPHSTIAVRLLLSGGPVDSAFFEQRIVRALQLRQQVFGDSTVYRLVFGESDLLPGLIVDRYGDWLAVQFLSAGMEARAPVIVDALRSVLPQVHGIIAKNDTVLRQKEGLVRSEEILWGTVPTRIDVQLGDVRMYVDLVGGQKTGLYLDQRDNYRLVAHLARNRRVLDCFTHEGGFALHCALAGAAEVVGVDSSVAAIALARANAELNGLGTTCRFVEADVFDFLAEAVARGEQWDMVILDPPAFAKSTHHIPSALRGYAAINRRALQLLGDGGILVSASCSHHISAAMLLDVVSSEARRAGCRLRLLARGMQSPCHPIYPPMPETEYLKLLIFEVLRLNVP
jgi:23S rRNA (cytosine1962-C5)-methyltransferase